MTTIAVYDHRPNSQLLDHFCAIDIRLIAALFNRGVLSCQTKCHHQKWMRFSWFVWLPRDVSTSLGGWISEIIIWFQYYDGEVGYTAGPMNKSFKNPQGLIGDDAMLIDARLTRAETGNKTTSAILDCMMITTMMLINNVHQTEKFSMDSVRTPYMSTQIRN